MKTALLAAALAAATVSLTGCRDSTGSDATVTGRMTFSFAGARNGTFFANGALRRLEEPVSVKRPFAAARKYVEQGSPLAGVTVVMAYAPVTESKGIWVLFDLPDVTAGQTLDLSCPFYTAFCPGGIVVFDVDRDLGPGNGEDGFSSYAGTMTITSVSGGRLRGTFSATAQAYHDQRTITITGGSFDVPLLDRSYYTGDRAAPGAAYLRRRDQTRRNADSRR